MNAPADPRLILREDELDAGLELLLLAEASIWAAVDQNSSCCLIKDLLE